MRRLACVMFFSKGSTAARLAIHSSSGISACSVAYLHCSTLAKGGCQKIAVNEVRKASANNKKTAFASPTFEEVFLGIGGGQMILYYLSGHLK